MTDASARPLAPGLIARVAAGLRYIAGGDPPDWFGPLDPMPPMAPPAIAGRSFDFPVGVNLRIQPRPDEPVSFAELRALADGYDLLRLVIETRKDQIQKFDWSIRKRVGGAESAGAGDPRIGAVEDLLRYPDREHDFGTWLRLLLEDLLVIDAPTVYVRRDAGGAVYALEVVDGATIKRVIDERGRTPLPPSPAYQQILKGLPAIDYTTGELIYRPRNPRPHKIYGFSPVEQVVMTVNIALRRQVAQLQYYTEGNVPEAMVGVPESWSPDQIRQFQDYWDALLEGNTAARRHAKFVPGGMRPTFTREPMLKDEYDEWLARVVCFAFSVAPTPFVRDSNRATAETTQQAALAEGLSPLLRWVKGLLDEVIHRHLGYPDLEFAWADSKDQDPQQQAEIDDTYVRAGIKSVDEVRAELGLDAVGFGNAIYTGQGAVPLKDVGAQAAPPAAKRALAKYDPDQPRAPAGSSNGGQWTSGGGSGGGGEDSEGGEGPDGGSSGSPGSGAMVAAADNVGTMSDADAPPVPPQLAQDESVGGPKVRLFPAMGAARAIAAARDPASAGSLLKSILQENPAEYVNTRATTLQSTLPAITRDRVTMAVGVVEDGNGVRSVVISSTEVDGKGISYIRNSTTALVQPDEVRVPATVGEPAEINILKYAEANKLKVIAVGAGRPYCGDCAQALDEAGVLATGPRK